MNAPAIPGLTEHELAAVEAELLRKFGAERPLREGRGGNSPYSPEDVVYGPRPLERGERAVVTPVARSHNGAGRYKGRGRWRTVWLAAPSQEADRVVCTVDDRGAAEIGSSGLFTRPLAVHTAEEETRGMGEGMSALAEALRAAGLAD